MGTWGMPRALAALVTVASITAVLSGCATTQTDADVPPPSRPAATPSSSPSPTLTPTLSPTPSAIPEPAATCETVLIDEEYAKLETDGLTFRGPARGVNPDLQPLVDTGISCHWVKPSTDILAWYTHWPSDEEQWESLRAELLGEGYIEIADPFPGILQAPPDPEYKPALTFRDGVIYYVSAARLLGSAHGLQ